MVWSWRQRARCKDCGDECHRRRTNSKPRKGKARESVRVSITPFCESNVQDSQQSKKTTHIQTSCTSNGWLVGLKLATTSLWGPRAVDGLIELDFRFEVERDTGKKKDVSEEQDTIPIIIRGLVSNPSSSSAMAGGDKQLFYINSRPCTLPKVGKIFNEVLKACSPLASPVVVVNLSLPTGN